MLSRAIPIFRPGTVMSPSLEVTNPPDITPIRELVEKAILSVDVSSLKVTDTTPYQKFELEDHPIDEVPSIKVGHLGKDSSCLEVYVYR